MSAITSEHLRTLRATVVDPKLTDTQRRGAAFAYLDAVTKTPPPVWLWSWMCDWVTGCCTEYELITLREAIADALRYRRN